MEEEKKVTTVEELKSYAIGKVVELPPFDDGMPFVARLRRPSVLGLVKSGKIPNALLSSASLLFNNKGKGADDVDFSEAIELIDVFVKEALVSPSYSEILESGMDLTVEQRMAIFNYTQEGVKALDSFRKE